MRATGPRFASGPTLESSTRRLSGRDGEPGLLLHGVPCIPRNTPDVSCRSPWACTSHAHSGLVLGLLGMIIKILDPALVSTQR